MEVYGTTARQNERDRQQLISKTAALFSISAKYNRDFTTEKQYKLDNSFAYFAHDKNDIV